MSIALLDAAGGVNMSIRRIAGVLYHFAQWARNRHKLERNSYSDNQEPFRKHHPMLTKYLHPVNRWNVGSAVAVFAFIVVAASFTVAKAAKPVPTPPIKLALTTKANYERPFEPPTRPAFIPLPSGAVEPEGWLRDWCMAAKDGYTGHMDDVDSAFRKAWASDYKMTGDHVSLWDQGAWPYEGGGYWLEGLVKLGYILHDDALIEQAKSRLDVVVDNMNPDGIVFMWWLNKNRPEDMKAAEGRGQREPEWPMWANGLLGRAMAGYYAGSADNRVLKALETAYSGSRDWVGLGWSMSNPWPAFQTYTWTGNKEIKESLTALFTKEGRLETTVVLASLSKAAQR